MNDTTTLLRRPLAFAGLLERVRPAPRLRALPGGFTLAEWPRPAALDDESRDEIFGQLVRVSTRAFGADMDPYWAGRREGGYFQSITRFFLLADPAGEIAGWTGYHRRRFAGKECIFLDSTGVLPEYQRSGVISAVQARAISRELMRTPLSTIYLITRTESPVVYRMLHRALGPGRVFPAPGLEVPTAVQAIGTEVAAWLGQSHLFTAPNLTIAGAYASLDALYGELPSCGDTELDRFFRASLRPVDAFLVIARASALAAATYLARRALARRARVPRAVAGAGAGPDAEIPRHGDEPTTLRTHS